MIKGYYISAEEREGLESICHQVECEFNGQHVKGMYKSPDGKYYACMKDCFFIEVLVYDFIGNYYDHKNNIEYTYVLMDRDNEYHVGLFNATNNIFVDCTTGEILWEMEDDRYHIVTTWIAGKQVIILPIID